jgi:hypothetical protein
MEGVAAIRQADHRRTAHSVRAFRHVAASHPSSRNCTPPTFQSTDGEAPDDLAGPAHQRCQLATASGGQEDRRRPLGPGPHPAGGLATAPEALAPQEHHRPAADRQVAYSDRAAAVRNGPHAAAHAADHGDVVWTASSHSPPTSCAETTSKPSKPSSADPDLLRCCPTWGLPLAGRQTSARYARPQVPFGSPTALSAAPHHASWRRASIDSM